MAEGSGEKPAGFHTGRLTSYRQEWKDNGCRQNSCGGRFRFFCLQGYSACLQEESFAIQNLFLVAALLLVTYNLWDSYRADESRKEILEEYKEENRRVFSDTGSTEGESPDYKLDPGMDMPEVLLDDFDNAACIGILEIPSLNLELPVLSEWSYPNLKLAPCRYAGSAYSDNLVIAAHNYQTHFGKLKSVLEGSEVSFTDAAGNKFVYHVAAMEALTPQSVEEMTAGEWPLTLFTCTPDGKNRVTVRCE